MTPVAQDYVGNYRLVNLLRSGKACQIWEVLDDASGERLAIKLLSGSYARSREETALLRNEYRVGSKFDHPQIIKILSLVTERDRMYLLMELFPSPNLKQWIQQGIEPLLPVISSVVEGTAEGLGYMHSLGWIHRDVKPDNVLASAAGEVKVIDFALSQKRQGALARLLSSSKIQGTRTYMSPEQIRGQALDERSDIYSFGCVLHELFSGKPPFTAGTSNDLLMKHLKTAPPSLQSMNRDVSDEFAELVRNMMAKLPERRPAAMSEILLKLRSMKILKPVLRSGK